MVTMASGGMSVGREDAVGTPEMTGKVDPLGVISQTVSNPF